MLFKGFIVLVAPPPHIFPPLPYSSIVFPHSILVSPLSHIPLYFISSSLGDTISPTPHPGSLIMPLTLRVQHMYLRHSLSHVSTPPVCMCVGGGSVWTCVHTQRTTLSLHHMGSRYQTLVLGVPASNFTHLAILLSPPLHILCLSASSLPWCIS